MEAQERGPRGVGPRRSRRLWVLAAITCGVALIAIGMPMVLAGATPSYWRPIDPSAPGVQRFAEALESQTVSEATSVRPGGQPWTLELAEPQINAWLAARLPLWLANQGVDRQTIERMPHTMVNITDQGVELAAELRLDGMDPVLRLAYRPVVVEGEPARLRLDGAYIGRLRAPLNALVEQAEQRLAAGGRDAGGLVERLKDIELVLPLDDGRLVTVTDVRLSEGRAALICRTDFRPTP